MSSAIVFDQVSKRFPGGTRNAVDGVSLAVGESELVTILGTSGCGKTTLLKMVNRLYDPDAGSISVHGRDISREDPVQLRRGIGYVIQEGGLFPHMTVAGNIATVPRILGWDKARIDARVSELLALVGLAPDEFRTRYPAQLSGGQKQRVGLARALAADPDIMLLDEPFGAIDSITRAALQDELLAIHRRHGKCYLFVTHDIDEALRLGTRVMVMDAGRVQQYGPPQEILARPANGFVRSLLEPVLRRCEAPQYAQPVGV